MPRKGAYANLKHCPKCGVASLEFDRYRGDKNFPQAEYVCGTCGFGFRIVPSARVIAADRLFKEHRKLRGNKFEQGVSPENAEKWLQSTEQRHEKWYERLLRRGTTA